MEQYLKKRAVTALPHLLFSMTEPLIQERLEDAQIFVVLDKDILCECEPQEKYSLFYSSLITLLAVYFVLNLQYVKQIRIFSNSWKSMFSPLFLSEKILCLNKLKTSFLDRGQIKRPVAKHLEGCRDST